ncbi:MAG: type II toxin-antitoxin system VapC family toxin [Spirochaetaceae bacterium]|jgi:predicted nucleic acid-binding protein|nr:type II toxin-antitoxin system VapC family toxin [Spirochaetaceae bacterium]
MNGNKFVLDTNTVINYLNDKITLPNGGDNGDIEFFISVITELELFSKPAITPEEESKISAFLNDNVTIVDIDPRIKNETIAIRRTTKIKLPDCIIAATSIALKATLLTHDTEDLLPLVRPGYNAEDI